LLYELVCSILRNCGSELFKERAWKRLREVEIEGFIEALPEVLCDSPDILEGWRDKIDGRDVG